MRPSRRQMVALVRDRPGNLWLTPGRYDEVVAYLLGFEDGSGSDWSAGFQEWLVQTKGCGANKSWPVLVALLASEETVPPDWAKATTGEHQRALLLLWELLDAYDSDQHPTP